MRRKVPATIECSTPGLADGQGLMRRFAQNPCFEEEPMLANVKYIYALDMWTVEKRPNGWYFSKSAYHGDRHQWRGPYSSEFSVTLMIARELRQEIKKQHKP